MTFTPQDVLTYGGGAVALTMVLYIFFLRSTADSDKSRSVDDRVLRQLDERDETIRALNVRNKELNDRQYEMMQQSIALATVHGSKIMEAVDAVRREHFTGMQRVHEKLEQCEARDRVCSNRLTALEMELESYRSAHTGEHAIVRRAGEAA